MTADSAAPNESAVRRGRLAFRLWRKTRPFWGGLLLILSGAWILLSANRDLGNIQVHLGLAGFQSYVIPLVLILCGALAWFTPDQRIFYGVIGVAVAIYSLIGANLGGFIIGFLLGLFGGSLVASWIPVKRKSAVADAATADLPTSEANADEADEDVQESQGLDVIGPDDEDVTTGPLHDTLPTSTRSPLVPTQAARDGDEEQEGEQGGSFPRPRHAADEPEVAGTDLPSDGDETTGLASRLRKPPHSAIALLAVLSLGAVALVTFQSPSSAASESCATPAYQRALQSLGAVPSASPKSTLKNNAADSARKSSKSSTGTAGKSTTTGTSGASPKSLAKPASTPEASASPSTTDGLVQGLLNVVGGLLPGADERADGASDSPSPSASPTGTSDPSPSTSPKPSPKPSADPTAEPTAEPTGHPTATPTKTVKPSLPTPSPSDSPICAVSKVFSASDLGSVNKQPSKMTTADLTLHNLAYKGIADLPKEGGGTLKALWFTMDSSTSKPFELQPMVGDDHSIDIKSSELTVSGDVQFYCTSISGNLVVAGVGLVPLTFTVDSPPPAVLPEMEFTDVTIQLAYVQSNVLTAKSLDISTT